MELGEGSCVVVDVDVCGEVVMDYEVCIFVVFDFFGDDFFDDGGVFFVGDVEVVVV